MRKKDKFVPPPWFKVYSHKVLAGSIRFDLSPAERSVWFDLLSFANESPVRGIVCASKGIPFPLAYLASVLQVPLELIENTLAKCKAEGRISEDGRGIIITHWEDYQAPYTGREGKQLPLSDATPDPDKYIKGAYGHMVQR